MAPRKSNGSSGKRTRPQLMDACVVESQDIGVFGVINAPQKDNNSVNDMPPPQKKARVEATENNEQEVPTPAPISEVNSPSISSNEGSSNNARLMRPLEATNKAVSMSVQFLAEKVKAAFDDKKRKSLPTKSEDNMSAEILTAIKNVLSDDAFLKALESRVREQAKTARVAIHAYDAAKTARVQLSEEAKKYRTSILRFKPTLAVGMGTVTMLLEKFPMPNSLTVSDKAALMTMINRWASA